MTNYCSGNLCGIYNQTRVQQCSNTYIYAAVTLVSGNDMVCFSPRILRARAHVFRNANKPRPRSREQHFRGGLLRFVRITMRLERTRAGRPRKRRAPTIFSAQTLSRLTKNSASSAMGLPWEMSPRLLRLAPLITRTRTATRRRHDWRSALGRATSRLDIDVKVASHY